MARAEGETRVEVGRAVNLVASMQKIGDDNRDWELTLTSVDPEGARILKDATSVDAYEDHMRTFVATQVSMFSGRDEAQVVLHLTVGPDISAGEARDLYNYTQAPARRVPETLSDISQ